MVNMENSTRKIVEDFGRSWFWKCTSEIGCLFSLFLILLISASMPVFEPWSNRLTGLLTVNLSRSRPGQLRRGNIFSALHRAGRLDGEMYEGGIKRHTWISCIYIYIICIYTWEEARCDCCVDINWFVCSKHTANISTKSFFLHMVSLTDSTQAPLVTGSCGTCSQECSRKRKYRSYAGDGQHPRTWFTSRGLHF